MKKEDVKQESTVVSSNGITVKQPCQESLSSEELEASERTEKEDQEKFASISKNIRNSISRLLILKTEKPENASSEIEEIRIKVLMMMMALRKLSRIQKIRVKNSKEQTLDSRQQVDGITLQLQNLLYEVSHLKKEVRRCFEFHSADQDIDLIPIDQFYLEAPETITRPEKTLDNEHEQRLAQLHWELEQRRGQTELFDKLTQEKKIIASVINEQERKLASLAPRVNGILESTKSLQQDIGINLDEQRDQQQIARYLPTPLYNLWVQATAYGEACSKSIKAQIGGDCDAVRKMNSFDDDSRTEISDSETELDALEDHEPQKVRGRKRRPKPDNDEVVDEGMKQLLSLHPLHITLIISMKDGNTINTRFYYATQLHIITTKCSVEMASQKTTLLVDVLSDETLLDCLFPGDDGRNSPNPSTAHLLAKAGKKSLTAEHWKQLGRPYSWAQTLAGIKFIESNLNSQDSLERPYNDVPTSSWQMSAEQMNKNILAIRRRFRARLSLHQQLAALETATSLNQIPLSIETLRQYFPAKVNTDLTSWLPITWSDFVAAPHSSPYIHGDLVNPSCLTFKAIFEGRDAVLEALVAIPPDYPYSPPVFCLSLNWMGHQTSFTDPNLKAMESEVNIYSGEMILTKEERLMMLSLQLYRLAMCHDIFTEAKCSQLDYLSSESKFHKEKIFFRPARGPERSLPFKYLPKLSVFSQR